jgi:hypothetical protein
VIFKKPWDLVFNSAKGGAISTPNVVISALFGVEITNNSAILKFYLLFSHHIALLFVISTPNGAEITIMSVEISFSFCKNCSIRAFFFV